MKDVLQFVRDRLGAMGDRPAMWASSREAFALQVVLLVDVAADEAVGSALFRTLFPGTASTVLSEPLDDAWARHVVELARQELPVPTPPPSPDDTAEVLERKLAAASRAHDDALRAQDQLAAVRDELRVALAYKRGTCLCAAQRHASCQRRRPWCTASECACDTCSQIQQAAQ